MSQTSVDDTTLRPDIAVDNCAENVVAEPDGGVVVRGSGAENVTVEDDDAGDHENGELGQRSEGPVTFAEEFSLQEEEQLVDVSWLEPEYWDASRMARLSAASAVRERLYAVCRHVQLTYPPRRPSTVSGPTNRRHSRYGLSFRAPDVRPCSCCCTRDVVASCASW